MSVLLYNEKGNYKYDILNANFDLYVRELMEGMSEKQRNSIPDDIVRKLYKGRKAYDINNLSFAEKMYLMSVVFGRQVIIFSGVIDDEKESTDILGLKAALKAARGKSSVLEYAESMRAKGNFFIGDKELMESVSFSRLVSVGDIYRTVIPAMKRKPTTPTKFEEHRKAFRAVIGLLLQYETNKKRLYTDYAITIPEWYTLLYYFDCEKRGRELYNGVFKQAHGASRPTMKAALTRLSKEGYLNTRGTTKARKYSLSAKGEQVIQRIFDTIVFAQ